MPPLLVHTKLIAKQTNTITNSISMNFSKPNGGPKKKKKPHSHRTQPSHQNSKGTQNPKIPGGTRLTPHLKRKHREAGPIF